MKTGSASEKRMVRVMVVDDHDDLMHPLASTIGAESDLEMVALAASLGEAHRRLSSVGCDVVILDTRVGFSCRTADEDTVVLQDGNHTLAEALEQIPPPGASLVSIMHTLAVDTPAALWEVRGHWSGDVGAYPHSGEFVMPNWRFINTISPEEFTKQAQGWTGMGVLLIGGCCGIGPEHIRQLKERLLERPS